jgi:O-antigen/teichoic acid export membrane protein
VNGSLQSGLAAGPGRPDGVWAWLGGLARRKNTLALADQAVVSGSNFLTTVLIGRWCGAEELGVYSLGFSLLVSWACVQESLIALPYTIYRHRSPEGTEAEFAGSVLVHQGMLSLLSLLVLAAAAGLASAGTVPGLAAVLWTLAGMIPFALLREFGRRFAFARLRMAQALLLDAAVAAVQLTGLVWLATVGALSATTGYAVIGVACAVPGAVWLYRGRGSFVVRWGKVRPAMRQSWALGRWLFVWQVTLSVQAYYVHWLVSWLVGTTATGVYAACMTVPLFANPLILGIANSLAPGAAEALNRGGFAELRRVVFQTTLLVGTAMVPFCVVVALSGEQLMDLLYDGAQYEGQGQTVTVLTLSMLMIALGMPPSNGLMAAERPDVVCKVSLIVLGVSLVLVPGLVVWWGLAGAAYGFLAGNVAGSVWRWVLFLVLVPRSGAKPDLLLEDEPAVVRVLRQLTGGEGEACWEIEQLGEGVQATVYAVRTRDGQPVWRTHGCLVVKLYRPEAGPSLERVRGQLAALSRLHEAVHGGSCGGWKTFAPAPLYLCESPLAQVMTMVPGRELDWHLETGAGVSQELLETAPRAVAAAMRNYWALGELYGALSFCNLLCDVNARELSFVDVGLESDSFLCDRVPRRWYPASRDLAYLLYQTGVRVKHSIGHPAARGRQQTFTDGVVRAFLETVESSKERQCLLDEIQACVRVHLRTLDLSWSPRGLWHVLLSQVASRRIDKLMAGLRESCVENEEV